MATHVVLVHGTRLSSTQWAPQLPLLEARTTVSLVDLPGHGLRADEAFTMARCVEVIDQAVSGTPDGDRVVLVGHSLGGYVAMAYAAEWGARLDGLVLAGCSADPIGPGAAVYRRVAALTERLGPARMTAINNWILRRHYPASIIEPVIAGGYYFSPTAPAWGEVMMQCRSSMLADLDCPVLVLNGQYDQFRVGTRKFTRGLRDVRVEVIPGASHLSTLDRPEEFAAAVLSFCEDLP